MDKNEKFKTYKIHTTYAIAILIAVIVGLISVEWSEVPNLYNYINFALTMSSLILAILAIIYALHSSGTLFKTLEKIEDSASQIKETSREIKQSNKELGEEVSKIPASLEKVDEKVESSHTLIMSLSETNSNQPKDKKSETNISKEIIVSYLKNSSLLGYQALVIALELSKSQEWVDFQELCKEVSSEEDVHTYMFAYIVSSSAIGIISYNSVSNDLLIPNSHPELEPAIKETYEEKYQSFVEGYMPDERSEEGDKDDLIRSLIDIQTNLPKFIHKHRVLTEH